MFLLKSYAKPHYSGSPILPNHRHALQTATKTHNPTKTRNPFSPFKTPNLHRRKLSLRSTSGSNNGPEGDAEKPSYSSSERKPFLTLEEAGLVEISGLSTHERFLCRLTISSLNLLRVISEQEGCAIEELNAGRICDWFIKDRLKREQNLGSAVLQWDDSEPF